MTTWKHITIPKDRDTLIEQSQLKLSDCSIRVSDWLLEYLDLFARFCASNDQC